TLTRNEMTVRSVVTAAGEARAEGSGYAPEGLLVAVSGGEAALEAAAGLARIGALCSDAQLRRNDHGEWHSEGDPMEGALLALAGKAGLDARDLRDRMPRLDEVPFDARHRFMATLHAW